MQNGIKRLCLSHRLNLAVAVDYHLACQSLVFLGAEGFQSALFIFGLLIKVGHSFQYVDDAGNDGRDAGGRQKDNIRPDAFHERVY